MRQYRYRTSVLVGPWRETRAAAALDAIRSRQAKSAETGEGLIWLVPGEIETAGDGGCSRETGAEPLQKI